MNEYWCKECDSQIIPVRGQYVSCPCGKAAVDLGRTTTRIVGQVMVIPPLTFLDDSSGDSLADHPHHERCGDS